MGEALRVCVAIAAYNAEATVGRAVSSALGEAEVAEVVVVDDASTDKTCGAAHAADDRSGRLKVVRLDENRGPSFARNAAIESTVSPFISVLDSDDYILPNRFKRLSAMGDWDVAADNIIFIHEDALESFRPPAEASASANGLVVLTIEHFVQSNISRRTNPRGELGFLKATMRRDFLNRNGLRYNESLRWGEDYELYTRALALGARFRITSSCGYVAVGRSGSLSRSHSTDDLKRLADADRAMLTIPGLSRQARSAIERHERHILSKYQLRRFLDIKASRGLAEAASYACSSRTHFLSIATGVARDKLLTALSPSQPFGRRPSATRFLISQDL